MRTATAIVISVLLMAPLLPAAHADIVRHITFPAVLLGTWAENADQCAAKDKSNVLIESANYGDGSGSCVVRWIVETAGSHGTNYAVHALCTTVLQLQTAKRRARDHGTELRQSENLCAVPGHLILKHVTRASSF